MINKYEDGSREVNWKGWTLRATKSTRSSALALKGLGPEEIFRHSSFNVEGVWEEAEPIEESTE